MKDGTKYFKIVNHKNEEDKKYRRKLYIEYAIGVVLAVTVASSYIMLYYKMRKNSNHDSIGTTITTEISKEEYEKIEEEMFNSKIATPTGYEFENVEENNDSYVLKYKKSSN